MDLQNYFAELEAELLALGMSETQSKAYCKRLLTSLSVLDEKTRQEKMQGYGTPAELAKRVGAIAAKQAPQATPTQDEEKSMEHTVNVGGPAPVKTRDDVTRPIPVIKEEKANEEDTPAPVKNDVLQATRKKPVAIKIPTEPAKEEKTPLSRRGMALFFGSAILTSPITLGICALLCGLFLSLCAALVVLAVVMFVAVTVTVICGILLALVCLGYGIVKMLPGTDAFFIGLYEFGLGMIVVGATIVFPILEYNCATALVPYTIKKLFALLKLIFRQIKRLVVYLFGLCRNL